MIRILLVDDQNLVQQGIKSLLDQDESFQVIGTVEDGESAIKQINILRPDIVLLDIEMPGMNGITVTKYINHFLPETKVIILSSHEEKKYLVQALVAGASSYILKSSLMKDLKQAILAVDNGYSLIESRLLARVLSSGTVKLVPVKPETIQNTTEPTIEESPQLNESNHNESDLLLVNRNKAKENIVDEPQEEHLVDFDTAQELSQPETTPEKSISIGRETTTHESIKTIRKLDTQNSNLNGVSNIAIISDSNSANSMVKIEPDNLDIELSEQKNKIKSDHTNGSLDYEVKAETPLNDQIKLEAFKRDVNSSPLYNQSLDEPSYQAQITSNKASLNTAKDSNKTALVPVDVTAKSNNSSTIVFGSNIAPSKTKIVVFRRYLSKINNRVEIKRLKSQIIRTFQPISSSFSLYFEQNIKPIVLRYQPLFNQYKSRFLRLISKRSTQKKLWNLGLIIFGGIIVLLIYSL